MCLYPRLIPNPKYKTSKKRGYYKPSPHDARLNYYLYRDENLEKIKDELEIKETKGNENSIATTALRNTLS